MTNTPAPIILVILAALLLSCNVLWLYTTPSNSHRNVCGYVVDSWSGGVKFNHKNGGNESTLTPPLIPVQDYQQVRGSGLSEVPFPIPIPNDTVLLGSDMGEQDGLRKRYMTIGIASVWRKEEYLFRTLDSILKETSDTDSEEIFIFLLLADADPDFRLRRAKDLESRYSTPISQGILRVIQPPTLLYPSIDFASIRRTYNDSVSRVQWRTKQVLDFAFLFWYAYSRQPSTYYLILEDDILSARHFVTAIRDFVGLHHRRHWVALQLSGFLGIGQLIRCSDMDRLVSFLLLFYREHPVDVLFNHWVQLMAPQKPPKDCPYRRVPGLFQHVGIHSTLANKTQPLRDTTFSLVRRRFSHVNPPAEVVTTIRQYKSFVANLAYSSAPGMFWGVPKSGDTYDIVLNEPMVLRRIVIITGAAVTKRRVRDKLQFGQLQVSPRFEQMISPKRAECSNFVALKEFAEGEVDVKNLESHFKNGIQCIRIVIGNKQRTWVSISEIAVFTDEKNITYSPRTIKTPQQILSNETRNKTTISITSKLNNTAEVSRSASNVLKHETLEHKNSSSSTHKLTPVYDRLNTSIEKLKKESSLATGNDEKKAKKLIFEVVNTYNKNITKLTINDNIHATRYTLKSSPFEKPNILTKTQNDSKVKSNNTTLKILQPPL